MGTGGHHPGEIYVVEVTAKPNVLVLTGDTFDPSYFKEGQKYVAIFTPYCEYSVGTDSAEPQPGS